MYGRRNEHAFFKAPIHLLFKMAGLDGENLTKEIPELCYTDDSPTDSGAVTPSEEEPFVIGDAANNGFFFDRKTQTFDISHGSTRSMTLGSDFEQWQHKGVTIDPSATCLVIVDMQNYFINPEYHTHPGGIAAIRPLLKTIQRCRETGIQIVWLNWCTNEKELKHTPPSVLRAFSQARLLEQGHGWGVNLGSQLPNGERVLFESTKNADIYDPLKEYSDPVNDVFCRKTRMSGMWSPHEDLHRFLCTEEASGEAPTKFEFSDPNVSACITGAHHRKRSKYSTLLFAGINTDQCVLSTLTDAHSWGWHCVLLSDCTGTATKIPNAHNVAVGNIAVNMGFITTSNDFCAAQIKIRTHALPAPSHFGIAVDDTEDTVESASCYKKLERHDSVTEDWQLSHSTADWQVVEPDYVRDLDYEFL